MQSATFAVLLPLVPDGVASRFRKKRVGRSVCDLQFEASAHLIFELAFLRKAEINAGVCCSGQFANSSGGPASRFETLGPSGFSLVVSMCVFPDWGTAISENSNELIQIEERRNQDPSFGRVRQ